MPRVVLRYADLGSTALGARDYPFEEVNFGWDRTYEVEVPARTLSSLLDDCAISALDLLSLDVEGFETEALKGLDLARHRPAFVLVEHWTEERLAEICSILGRGYALVERVTDHDAFFRRVDTPSGSSRAEHRARRGCWRRPSSEDFIGSVDPVRRALRGGGT